MPESMSLDDCVVMLARNENVEAMTHRLSLGGSEAVRLILHAGAGVNAAELAKASQGDRGAARRCLDQARRVMAGPPWLRSQPIEKQALAKSAAIYIIAKLDDNE